MENLDFILDSNSYHNSNTPIISNHDSVKNSKTDLQLLIRVIKNKIKNKDPSISKVKYPKLLLVSLKELNSMTGMDRLKESIALQIMRLIQALNERKRNKNMLNTILYGPPGVGKTKVGIILAKIWYSLGYLNSQPPSHQLTEEKNRDINPNINNTNQMTSIIIFIALFLMTYVIQGLAFVYNKFGLYWLMVILSFIIFISIIIYLYSMPSSNTTVHQENIDININIDSKRSDKTEVLDRDIITVVSRRELVADYVGQTAGKTKRLLMANLGKVVFIDEAYSLLNDSRDPFGLEALSTLTLFMSENPNGIVVILAGYKDLMQNGIFKEQPGLPRRCMWHFECDPYTGSQLSKIFLNQLSLDGWSVDNKDEVVSLIEQNSDLFPSYGGDTERLCSFSQLESSRDEFLSYSSSLPSISSMSSMSSSNGQSKTLTVAQIQRGMERLKTNNIHKDSTSSTTDEEQKGILEGLKNILSTQQQEKQPERNRYNPTNKSHLEDSDIDISI
jgi:uncharacterized membrane protein